MIKAILMDFNGVIINDEPLQLDVYKEILNSEGVALTDEDYYSSLGMDDRTFIAAAFKRAGRDAEPAKISEIHDAKTEKWRERIDSSVPLFDGVENFIRMMEKEFTLGIVSMSRRGEIEHVLEKTGLRDCFSTIVSAEDVSVCKPNPECFHKGFGAIDAARTAEGHLPMTHRECLAIEDAPQGIIAAKQVRLKTLGITNTVNDAPLRDAGADAVSATLADWMPEAIRRVFV